MQRLILRSLVLFLLIALLPISLFAQTAVLYNRDGLTLVYSITYMGNKEILLQPGLTQTMKFYEVVARLSNASGKDINFLGQSNVSFFSVSKAWNEGGNGIINFSSGIVKSGTTLSGKSTFLLNPSYGSPGQPTWQVSEYSLINSSTKTESNSINASSMSNGALLDRFAELNPGFKSGTLNSSEKQEIDLVLKELLSRMQGGKLSLEEMQRYLALASS